MTKNVLKETATQVRCSDLSKKVRTSLRRVNIQLSRCLRIRTRLNNTLHRLKKFDNRISGQSAIMTVEDGNFLNNVTKLLENAENVSLLQSGRKSICTKPLGQNGLNYTISALASQSSAESSFYGQISESVIEYLLCLCVLKIYTCIHKSSEA